MGELIFVGLGLHDEKGISLRGLEALQEADAVFMESYTSLMPGLRVGELEAHAGKEVTLATREMLEEENGERILAAARNGRAVLLVPGDPLIATTHIDLRIRAEESGIRTRIIHGASIISATVGLTGLQNYKFGRSVTIAFSIDDFIPETPYDVIKANLGLGLHTLCFLDAQAKEMRFMTIAEALDILLVIEKRRREAVIAGSMVVIGIAGAGSKSPAVKAGLLDEIIRHDFGHPPHTLVFPGRLHFMETKALIRLAGAPRELGSEPCGNQRSR